MTTALPNASSTTSCQITSSPIDLSALSAFVSTPATGAVVEFTGRVRDHDHGRVVVALEYEAHPTAAQVLDKIVRAVSGQFSDARIAAIHRTGRLGIGEVAMAVAVGTSHRTDAFDACRALVEEIKASLPIWKLQTFDDGTTEWVNCL